MAKIVKSKKKNQKITSKVKMKSNLSPKEIEYIKVALYDWQHGTSIKSSEEEVIHMAEEIAVK